MKSKPEREAPTLAIDCPNCGRRPVTLLLPSTRGVYCRCPACGHMWQQPDYAYESSGGPPRARRRRSDAAAKSSGAEPQAAICPFCRHGMKAEHRCETVHLQSRIADLEAENADLRRSARAFGDLAERLNQLLRARPRS